jgi:hypothetical protein
VQDVHDVVAHLANVDHLSRTTGPRESPCVVRLATAGRVEVGAIEDDGRILDSDDTRREGSLVGISQIEQICHGESVPENVPVA